MADKLTTKEALQAAIGDYNTWALKEGGIYDAVKAYSDIRGIFYNKLAARLKESSDWYVGRTCYRRVIPDDLACVFDPKTKYLVNLVIPTYDANSERGRLLVQLAKFTTEVEYDYFISPGYLESAKPLDPLEKIVNALKSYKT